MWINCIVFMCIIGTIRLTYLKSDAFVVFTSNQVFSGKHTHWHRIQLQNFREYLYLCHQKLTLRHSNPWCWWQRQECSSLMVETTPKVFLFIFLVEVIPLCYKWLYINYTHSTQLYFLYSFFGLPVSVNFWPSFRPFLLKVL